MTDYIRDERGEDYRGFVGPRALYDVIGAAQFCLMVRLGLRQHHYLCDVGCGSLRGGRFFIPYLEPGHYYGFDPNYWLIEEAVRHEIGQDMVDLKRPTFDAEADFTLTKFAQSFHYVVARSVFSHASLAQIERCLSEAAKAMRAGGVFAASMHLDGTETYTGGWAWPHCAHHRREDIESLAREFGLEMQVLADEPRYGDQDWVTFVRAGRKR